METTNWNRIPLNKVFEISFGNKFDRNKMSENPSSDIAFVTRTADNNGIACFVDAVPNVAPFPAGLLTIALGGSIGSTFVQSRPFYTCQNVAVLIPRFEQMNIYHKIFASIIIQKETDQHFVAFGREINKYIKRSFFIDLPFSGKSIDWDYMELFIKNKVLPKAPNYARQVWEQTYNRTPISATPLELHTENWKYFDIEDYFDVQLSKGDLKEKECLEGDIPLISAGTSNNGLVKYIDEKGDGKALTFDANSITVDMFCSAFYQPNVFYAVSHGRVNILIPKFAKFNCYVAMFLCTIIEKETFRFSYGRAVYSSVIKKTRIKLPATPDGEPDWAFMEAYIKSLPYSRNI